MKPTALNILTLAQARIAKRKDWTQRSYARDRHSRQCTICSPRACRWCATGAMYWAEITLSMDKFEGVYGQSEKYLAFRFLRKAVTGLSSGRDSIVHLNDQGGRKQHAAVMDMFDRAIPIAHHQSQ